MTEKLEGNQKPWDAVHDFDYRGFKCTVVRYTNERPNLAREFLEGFIAFEWWCGYVEIPKENKFYQNDELLNKIYINDASAKDAIGDMIIFTLNYCNKKGFNFEECIRMAWEEASKRDWIKYPKNGVNE